MISTDWNGVVARRLERSSLAERGGADALAAVAHELCGVQAQVQLSAELQLAARVDGLGQVDVRDALWSRRTLVKAWTVRGTLHLHPSSELALWHAARRAVTPDARHEGLGAWHDPDGGVHPPLDGEEVQAVRAAVWDVLDGRCMLRSELADEVVKRLGPAPRERLRSGFAFFMDELCQGPPSGSKVTFVRPDQWIAGWRPLDEGEALREACRRFLHAYGPARPGDFSEWFGPGALKVSAARALFDSLGSEIEAVEVDGGPAFVLAGDTSFTELRPSIRLLPEYDAYIMGSRERERLVPKPVRDLIARHKRGRYEGPAGVRFVLVDGLAAGLWERTRRGKRIDVQITLARKLARSRRTELEHEVDRIGSFLGADPVVSWTG
jgi:Winged helix DNA-binding domain